MSGGGTTPFPAASPAGGLHSYTPSPAHTPYSQHSSPAPSRTPTYTDSHHFAPQVRPRPSPPSSPPRPRPSRTHLLWLAQGGSGTSGSGSGYGGELSHEIGAAISSPAPVSPGMAALDFEPPRDPRDDAERDHSPMGSTDMHPGSNSNSSLSDYNKVRAAPAASPPLGCRLTPVLCPQTSGGSDMSPAGVVGANTFGGALYEGEQRLQYSHLHHTHSPAPLDKQDHYYRQDQGDTQQTTCRDSYFS